MGTEPLGRRDRHCSGTLEHGNGQSAGPLCTYRGSQLRHRTTRGGKLRLRPSTYGILSHRTGKANHRPSKESRRQQDYPANCRREEAPSDLHHLHMKSAELNGTNPRFILADEAGQATEPTAAVLLANAVEGGHVMIVGDEHQLAPTVKGQRAEWDRLSCSLLARLNRNPKGLKHLVTLEIHRDPIQNAPGHPNLPQHPVLRRRPQMRAQSPAGGSLGNPMATSAGREGQAPRTRAHSLWKRNRATA